MSSLVLVSMTALAWLMLVYPARPAPGRGRELRLTVANNESMSALAARLADRGAIAHPGLFSFYARLLGADERLHTGEVLLTDDMSPRGVLQRIASGFGAATLRVTLPEGFDTMAIAARLERWDVVDGADFLAATRDPALLDELGIAGPSAEGYLYPDTYRFPEGLPAQEVVRRLVHNHRRRVGSLWTHVSGPQAALFRQLSWGPREILTLASIVEKEAVVDEERGIIARVFINRMLDPEFRPHRLQADPTVSYGCRSAPEAAPSCARFDGRRITRTMLRDAENMYNTYRHEGLPPGPITNPGLSSIRAVVQAPEHRFLYFVARGHGRHAFSANLADHNRAVARYRRRRAQP